MPDDELGVGGLLARLQAPLREAHARLQLVVEDAAVAHHEEEVLLVALRRLALHVPVVFPERRENEYIILKVPLPLFGQMMKVTS